MEIVIRTRDGDGDVSLTGVDEATTLDDVARRVGSPASTPLVLSGLVDGAVVDVEPDADECGASGPPRVAGDDGAHQGTSVVELVQVAGPGGGHRRRLSAGCYRVGNSERVDTVELQPGGVASCAFELRVDPRGGCRIRAVRPVVLDGRSIEPPRRSTVACASDGDVTARRHHHDAPSDEWVDWRSGVLAVDGKAFVVRRVADTPRPRRLPPSTTRGLVAFNRPPRAASAPAPPSLEVPEGGREVRDRRRFPLLAVLAPVPVAVTIALVASRPLFLLFGLMSPLMMLANVIEDRRARRRELKEARGADSKAFHEFREAIARAHAEAVQRARAAHPDIATTMLQRATELIRGMPFAESGYLWPDAEGITSRLVMMITSCTAELGELALAAGDLDTVLWSTGVGLQVLSGQEELIGLRMRAHAQRNDPASVRREWEASERVVLSDPWSDGETSPSLLALRQELVGAVQRGDVGVGAPGGLRSAR